MEPGQVLLTRGRVAAAGGLQPADILIENGRIARVSARLEASGATVIDVSGLVLGPGFIDVHVHGGGGHSFFTRDPASVSAYAAWAPRNGVTAFLVSTLGRDHEETVALLDTLGSAFGVRGGAEPLGFHLEGPFINPGRKGAFSPGMLRPPSVAEFAAYQRAARGRIRQVTIAPELPGAIDLVRSATTSGAVASIGHTDGTAAEVQAGFEAGARHVTHLFNAMRPLHQREGGPIAACLLEERATCELICDGAHVAPEVLRLAYRILGPERTVVVTDNLHLAGTEIAAGSFGGQAVTVEGARAVRSDGTIVGSVATMDQHFRNAIELLGVDIPTAFRLCSTNPARVAGVLSRKGTLTPGMDADIVALDARLEVAFTICRGVIAWRRPE